MKKRIITVIPIVLALAAGVVALSRKRGEEKKNGGAIWGSKKE